MPDAPRRLAGRTAAAAALFVLAVLAGSCSTDGRTLAAPDPQLTATTPPTTIPPTTVAPVLTLSSRAFEAEGTLPDRFTCNGDDVAPPLSFSNVPPGTLSLTITLTDPDASGFVHWVATGIDPTTTNLATNRLPEGAVVYPNDFGRPRYEGPCPPEGETHRYVYTLYAVPPSAASLLGPEETNGAAVIALQTGLATAIATLGVNA